MTIVSSQINEARRELARLYAAFFAGAAVFDAVLEAEAVLLVLLKRSGTLV